MEPYVAPIKRTVVLVGCFIGSMSVGLHLGEGVMRFRVQGLGQ